MTLSRLTTLLLVTCIAAIGCAGEVTAPAADRSGTEPGSEWILPAAESSDTTGGTFGRTSCDPEEDPDDACGENDPAGGG